MEFTPLFNPATMFFGFIVLVYAIIGYCFLIKQENNKQQLEDKNK